MRVSRDANRGVELGYAEITSSQSGITSTTGVDITGLSLSFTVGARPVIVRLLANVQNNTAPSTQYLLITDSSNVQKAGALAAVAAANGYVSLLAQARIAANAGTLTYKARLAVSAGSATVLATAGGYQATIQAVEV